MESPYKGIPVERWTTVTSRLINDHPLSPKEIVEITLVSWESIFNSRMGTKGFRIGIEIFPKPQIMGFFLHELIPLELASRYPDKWRVETTSGDKDIVYIPDDKYSIELKTSSNPNHIYGNRSYAQKGLTAKKSKAGYCLAMNFESFGQKTSRPEIRLIRFGWIDSDDWIGQAAPTGQQSRLSHDVEKYKLVTLYKADSE